MTIYDRLRAEATRIPPPAVHGMWQAIQFQPDFATGERFNIGVVFFEHRKQTPHARLLPSLAGFRALYGDTGADNFKFLLSLMREQIVDERKAISPSPQILFTKKKFAAGNNPQEIVDRLYYSTVTLAAAKDEEEDDQGIAPSLKTEKLRQRVAKIARQKMGSAWPSIFRDEPVPIADQRGHRHALDLPIWRGEDLISAQIYGTILSAQFRSAAHRSASLSSGYVNFSQAASIATKAKGGLLILRPADDNPAYSQGLMDDIDNDIDKITWTFLKQSNIVVHVGETPEDLAQAALELL